MLKKAPACKVTEVINYDQECRVYAVKNVLELSWNLLEFCLSWNVLECPGIVLEF